MIQSSELPKATPLDEGQLSMSWARLQPLPSHARLYYPKPEGAHPLTPEAVRTFYSALQPSLGTLAWVIRSAGIGGVKSGRDEVTWELREGARCFFEFWTPGKGPGLAVLSMKGPGADETKAVAQAMCGDGRHLAWFRSLGQTLAEILETPFEEFDAGPYC